MSCRRTAGAVSGLLLAAGTSVAGCGTTGSGAAPTPVGTLVLTEAPAPAETTPPPVASTVGRPTTAIPSPEPTSAPSSSAAGRPPAAAPVPVPVPVPSITMPDLPTPHDLGIIEGADASWPQCPKGMGIPQRRTQGKPMPLSSAGFVVLGLTNGPAFHPNPCLADEVAWVKQRHLAAAAYSVISYPKKPFVRQYATSGPYDASTRLGRLGNLGYQEAAFNLATMRGAGLTTPIVWLDIEPVRAFDWPDNPTMNAAVVKGAARGYADAGLRVGVYSLASMWRRVVGDLRLGVPEWRPAGGRPPVEALRRCESDWMFQGGTAALAQWVDGPRDRDLTCPGTSTYLTLWFHQY